jgi:hypothetical protein
MSKRKPKSVAVRSEEAVLTVRKTIPGLPSTEVEERVKIRPFITVPGRVRVNKGVTRKVGDFEFVRVDVSFEVPGYVEELVDLCSIVDTMVEDRLCESVSSVLNLMGRGGEDGGEADAGEDLLG